MVDTISHYINNQCVKPIGEKLLSVYNPATGEKTAHVICATTTEINDTITLAKNAFTQWSQVTPLKRARVLFNFKTLLDKNIDKGEHKNVWGHLVFQYI